jgi:formylglycine-generating enzyme required for sulfatase activity
MMDFEKERQLPLTPAEAMTRAFKKHRLLLVIGDPGSGKTTLLKYYAVNCLDKKYGEFGFTEDVFPIFFPLRELDFNRENNEPTLLPQNLEKWSERHLLNISAQQFYDWLHTRKTLVLLDGLDEISSKEQRQKVCRWIKDMCNGLKNACFVVTSRSTGYRKLDGIELEVSHLRADIMDFSPDQQELFFCKYPVTNKRYRLFISYLEGKLKNLAKKLPLDIFADRLLEFSKTIKGYSEYIGKDPKQWQSKLRSFYDNDKKFNGDDQPVVGVTWYAARSYCFWLSCLDAAIREDARVLKGGLHGWAAVYRLPGEEEWEWAAGGNPDGSVRLYPWPGEKGEPNPNLANFNKNVGATTPVGRYPEGATPSGLMDMAGNAWEWMENLYREDKSWRALKGGSWYSDVSSLRCAARAWGLPVIRDCYGGFRVVRSQS